MKYKKCRICNSTNISRIYIDLPFFRHIDFTTISKRGYLYKCKKCDVCFNPNINTSEISIFKKRNYALSNQAKQVFKFKKFKKAVSRSFIQSKIIKNKILLKITKPRVLDIGCFDGELLKNLNSDNKKGDYWGFDVNPYLKKFFPKKNNFHFVSEKLDTIPVKFDLIILSHSIAYISNIAKLMKSINRLLKPKGFLYIQLANILKKPFYTLMGDQFYVFSEKSIKNTLNLFGFKSLKMNNMFFQEELILISKKNYTSSSKIFKKDKAIEKNISILSQKKKNLNKIRGPEIYVLGTTGYAAYIDEILKNKIINFLDENPSFTGAYFREKKLYIQKN